MRIIYIYILSFCLILFGGYRYAHGGTHHHPEGYTQAKHIEKAGQIKFAGTNEDVIAVSATISADDKQSIFNVEDDDDDFAFSRKYVLLTNFFASLVYAAFLVYGFKKLNNGLRNSRQLITVRSCTYLMQGALRI